MTDAALLRRRHRRRHLGPRAAGARHRRRARRRADTTSSTIHYVGAQRGIETTAAAADGLSAHVARRRRAAAPDPARNLASCAKLRARHAGPRCRLLRQLRPVVVSVGGYASLPATLAARRLRIPVVVVSLRPAARACEPARRPARRRPCAVAFDGVAAASRPADRRPGAPDDARRRSGGRPDAARADALGICPRPFRGHRVRWLARLRGLNEAVAEFVEAHADRRDLAVHHVVGSGSSTGHRARRRCGHPVPGDRLRGRHAAGLRRVRPRGRPWRGQHRRRSRRHRDAGDARAVARCGRGPPDRQRSQRLSEVGGALLSRSRARPTRRRHRGAARSSRLDATNSRRPHADGRDPSSAPRQVRSSASHSIDAIVTSAALATNCPDHRAALGDLADRPVPSRRIEPPLDLSRPSGIHVVGVGGPGMSADRDRARRDGSRGVGQRHPRAPRARSAACRRRRPCTSATTARTCTASTRSRASTAIPTRNIELDEARSHGRHRAAPRRDARVDLRQARSLAVAGTHGKTTTTSMLMLILAEAGLRPSFVIGGDVTDIGTGAQWTGGEWFVVEADESDGTHLELPLDGTILTNVEIDHLDHYGTVRRHRRGLRPTTSRQIPGPKVLCADDDPVGVAARHGRDGASSPTAPRDVARDVPGRRDRRRRRLDAPLRRSSVTASRSARSRCRCAASTTCATPRRRIAMALEIGVPFDAVARARPGSAASPAGSTSAASTAGRPSSTTTPTSRPRSPPCSAPPATAATAGSGSSRCSNRTGSPDGGDVARVRATRSSHADVVVLTDIYASGDDTDPRRHRQARRERRARRPPAAAVVWLPRAPTWSSSSPASCATATCASRWAAATSPRFPIEVIERVDADDVAARARRVGRGLGRRPVRCDTSPLAPLTTYRVGGPRRCSSGATDRVTTSTARRRCRPRRRAAGARGRARLEPARRRRRIRRVAISSPSSVPRDIDRSTARRDGRRRRRAAGAGPADRGGRARPGSSGWSACPARSVARCA